MPEVAASFSGGGFSNYVRAVDHRVDSKLIVRLSSTALSTKPSLYHSTWENLGRRHITAYSTGEGLLSKSILYNISHSAVGMDGYDAHIPQHYQCH